jgi:hypothetical protein
MMGWFQFTAASQVKAMKEAERRFAEAQEESERVARYAGEQLQRKPTKVEIFARAYCKELGYDPDAKWFPGPMMSALPMWTRFRDIAEREMHYQAVAAGFEALEAAHDAQSPKVTTTP